LTSGTAPLFFMFFIGVALVDAVISSSSIKTATRSAE
jgi:hypothetical protein